VIELRGVTWDHPRGVEGLRAAVDAYRVGRPDVSVTWGTRTLQAFADQPVDDLAATYDLIVLDHPSIGEAVARGAIAPFEDLVDRAVLDDQAASSVGRSAESYVWDGRRWALAIDAAAQVAAYRPDLLDDAGLDIPRTWAEVDDVARRLRDAGRWMALPATPVDAICAFLALAASGDDPGDDTIVDRDAGRDALGRFREVIALAHPESLGWNPPAALDRMASTDDVAYVPMAFGYVTYARHPRSPLRFAPAPAGDDGVPRGALGGAGLAVSARSSASGEAAAFAAFAASVDVQRTVYVDGGGQPAHRVAWTDPVVNGACGGFFADTLPGVDAAYLRPRHRGFLRFQAVAGDAVHAWLRGGADDAGRVMDAIGSAYAASLTTRVREGA
jgi:multiple sugar transport system substrate-binding protein